MTAQAAPWSPFENGSTAAETSVPATARPVPSAEAATCTLHPHLRVVPDADAGQAGTPEAETLHSAADPAPGNADSAPSTAAAAATETDDAAADDAAVEVASGPSIAERLDGLRAIWVPPNWRTERPASIDEVIAYADTAPWCAGDGKARKAGRLYNRVVAVPVSALAYVLAWIFQRPGRAVTVGVAVGLWGLVLLVAF